MVAHLELFVYILGRRGRSFPVTVESGDFEGGSEHLRGIDAHRLIPLQS